MIKCIFNLETLLRSTYSHSVILPRTTFPQKLEGEKRKILDQKIVASYEFLSVYRQQYEQRQHNQVTKFSRKYL